MKVLIIEDTIKLADNLKSYFEIAGHTSDVSYNLNDAYDFYKTSHYDIILLDIMLPDGDGREFLKKTRKNNEIGFIQNLARNVVYIWQVKRTG